MKATNILYSGDWRGLKRKACPKSPHSELGYVYGVLSDNGSVKIGMSRDPVGRLASLGRDAAHIGINRTQCIVTKLHWGYRDTESKAHSFFERRRISGESFTLSIEEFGRHIVEISDLPCWTSEEIEARISAEQKEGNAAAGGFEAAFREMRGDGRVAQDKNPRDPVGFPSALNGVLDPPECLCQHSLLSNYESKVRSIAVGCDWAGMTVREVEIILDGVMGRGASRRSMGLEAIKQEVRA